MPKPSLIEVFGANASQDSTTVTISKSALQAVGLTIGNDIPAEKILVALIKVAAINLSKANFDLNTDQQIYIDKGISSNTFRGSSLYKTTPYTITLAKTVPDEEIDPDDY